MADVLMYLVRMADRCDVDLGAAFQGTDWFMALRVGFSCCLSFAISRVKPLFFASLAPGCLISVGMGVIDAVAKACLLRPGKC